MKAILKLLQSWTLIVLLIVTVSSTTYAGTISIGNATGEPNQDFEITISIKDSSRTIEALGFDLEFAADAATYVGYELGELLVGFNEAGAVLIENNTVRVGGFSMDAIDKNSSGDLIILKFKAKDAVHDFDFLITGLTDDVVGHKIVSGQFEKFSPPVTPPVINTPTITPPTSGGFFGSTTSGGGGLFASTPSSGCGLFAASTSGGGTSGGGLFGSTPSGGKTSGGNSLFSSAPPSGAGLFASSTSSGGTSGGGFFGSTPSSGKTSGGSGLFVSTLSSGCGLFAASTSGGGTSGGGLFTPKSGAPSLVSSHIFSSPW